ENIKEEIKLKIIYPNQNPDIYKAYGKKSGGGVLLYGPPGCGKTLVSRATAGEIKSNFISIGLHQVLDMYIGNSEKNLHEIFELARANSPSVLFIDEIDALAANRTDLRHSASRTLINQFLAEMDGDINSNEGVLILGATNAPWYIDAAFRRPGRFDRIIFVPTPDEMAKQEIIKVLSKSRPVEKLDINSIARKTKDFSGADLKALFDLATEASLKKAMKENRVIPITTDDLIKQAKSIVPSSKAWFEIAKNYALFSNQSGLYDPILDFLKLK
ncbi:MAG: ATP-binding protein, partial [Candidatus Omnitrophica bacterium]|nr:ATP-binding protein [Candidatus Omnitrophota bacterium]